MRLAPRARAPLKPCALRAFADDGTEEDGEEDDVQMAEAGPAATEAARAAALKAQGQERAEQADYSAALRLWHQASLLTPEDATLHEQRSQVLMALHKDFEAVTAATRAIDLAPSWPVGWLTLGRAQLNLGEPQLALASYERCLQLEPGNSEATSEVNEVRVRALRHVEGTRTHIRE